MIKNKFFILPILFIIFSAPSFSSQDVKAISAHPTETTITPYNPTVPIGKAMTFHAKVADHTPAQNTPYGTVTWSDGGKGGKFSSSSCKLVLYSSSESTCSVTYTSSTAGLVTIAGSYGGGDGAHAGSSGITQLTVTLRTTTITITPNPATATIGKAITFHAKIVDSDSGTKTTPTGTVTWSDGGKGGIFSSSSCTLAIYSSSASTCAISYTPSIGGSLTINGTYGGDGTHADISGIMPLTVTLRTTTITITPNPATATIGKAITFYAKVNDPGTGTKILPTGTVTWDDGGKGGIFNSTSCTLVVYSSSASTCAISYTPSTGGSLTITGTYGGDGVHKTSSGTTQLTVALRSTTTTITGPVNATSGTKTTFSAKVNDPGTGTKILPTGTVTWSDGGKGGKFSSSSCTLAIYSSSESICSVTYTRSTTGSVTITGTYGGDSAHAGSFGTLGFKVY